MHADGRLGRARRPGDAEADESIAAPKGHGPPALRLFPCKPAISSDRRKGPRSPAWTQATRCVMVGEGHAPVVAVLVTSAKKGKAEESITAPKGHAPRPLQPFPCTTAISGLAGRGHDRRLWPLRADAWWWARAMPRCRGTSCNEKKCSPREALQAVPLDRLPSAISARA